MSVINIVIAWVNLDKQHSSNIASYQLPILYEKMTQILSVIFCELLLIRGADVNVREVGE